MHCASCKAAGVYVVLTRCFAHTPACLSACTRGVFSTTTASLSCCPRVHRLRPPQPQAPSILAWLTAVSLPVLSAATVFIAMLFLEPTTQDFFAEISISKTSWL